MACFSGRFGSAVSAMHVIVSGWRGSLNQGQMCLQASQQRPSGVVTASPLEASAAAAASAVREPSAAAVQAVSARVPARPRAHPWAGLTVAADPDPDFVDLISSDDDDGPRRSAATAPVGKGTADASGPHAAAESSQPQPRRRRQLSGSASVRTSGWTCPQCTLVNAHAAGHCEACGRARPLGSLSSAATTAGPAGVTGAQPPATPTVTAARGVGLGPHVGWQCGFCTLCNNASATHCGACGEWRYASGVKMEPLDS